ncbi:hypothetical protein NEMIN01_1753 [Nematocida minor]|uniref:uncharacterized protein n=1 Tax=Nematocida minor TaxID=1912983 RepID=UPI0022207773|nr:uncharacterized protein NEMIN01_1753 [Nematocida minor]KAI5191969.1 hypothetical protein NEMIN01_1753 [Nematocida minor]
MKNQKLRAILNAVTVVLIFFTMLCRGGGDALNSPEEVASTPEDRDASVTENDLGFNWFVADSNGAHIWDLTKAIEEFRDIYHPPSPSEKEATECGTSLASTEKKKSARSAVRRKRKAQKDESVPQPAPKSKKEGSRLENVNIKLWSDVRLTNKRRANSTNNHRTIYLDRDGKFNECVLLEITEGAYQEKIREYLEKFSENIAPRIEKNALWYFIACRTSNLNTRKKDLLGLKELLKEESRNKHKKMLMDLQGYYPNVIDDMLAYVEKHKPLRANKQRPPTVWNKTLGDIYIQRGLDLNYAMVEEQDKISQEYRKHSALAYALRMILALPEVHQDFSKISTVFIEATEVYKSFSKNKKAHKVLLAIHTLVKKSAESNKKIKSVYEVIHSTLESMQKKDKKKEKTVSELYRDLYMILADFYAKAKVFDDKRYILAGKCAIKHQKYIRCEAALEFAADGSFKQLRAPKYSPEMDKWDVSPGVKPHYHVHYVDNETHRGRRLCMPIYKKDGRDDACYMHTIDATIEYIKNLYGIEKNILHPFKVKKGTDEWSYIDASDRSKTAEDLAEHEIVFYRIEEDLKTVKFTFAKFKPLVQHGKDSIGIPLFLTRLMRSAIDLGPFVMEGEHSEISLGAEFKNAVPGVYNFNDIYKKDEYSDVHGYYSNLYILPDAKKRKTFDCYTMDCQTVLEDTTTKAVWYVNMTDSENAYTHCLPNEKFKEEENSGEIAGFINTLGSRQYNRDSNLQSIWLKNSGLEDNKPENHTQKIHTWLINAIEYDESKLRDKEIIEKKIRVFEESVRRSEKRFTALDGKIKELKKQGNKNKNKIVKLNKEKKSAGCIKYKSKKNIEELRRELHEVVSEKPDEQVELIVFRNVNSSNSNLGAHNEILDPLISAYNK